MLTYLANPRGRARCPAEVVPIAHYPSSGGEPSRLSTRPFKDVRLQEDAKSRSRGVLEERECHGDHSFLQERTTGWVRGFLQERKMGVTRWGRDQSDGFLRVSVDSPKLVLNQTEPAEPGICWGFSSPKLDPNWFGFGWILVPWIQQSVLNRQSP